VRRDLNITFIGGTGRCGTNILKKIFSFHSKVCTLPFEYRFIIDPDGIIDFYNNIAYSWSPYIADVKLRRLRDFLGDISRKRLVSNIFSKFIRLLNSSGIQITPKRYNDWELSKWIPNFQIHSDSLLERLKDFEYKGLWPGADSYTNKYNIFFSEYRKKEELSSILGDFLRSCIEDLLKKQNKQYFIEDNTWNILFAKELLELLPEGKLIHIYRDPRDVIASFLRQRWCPNNIKEATTWYESIILKWFKIKEDLPREKYIEIRLEDLCEYPKKEINVLCSFIGIVFEQNMLDIDLSKPHSGRWKKEFSKNEKLFIQNKLSKIINLLGYKI